MFWCKHSRTRESDVAGNEAEVPHNITLATTAPQLELDHSQHAQSNMIPSLQPSRPKLPPQPTHIQQQRRPTHTAPSSQPSQHTPPHIPPTSSQRPKNQIEAMPPIRAPPQSLPASTNTFTPALAPAQSFYDAATRHPVFFTGSLRKLPFPVPHMGSQGWSPVASGYVVERQRGSNGGLGTGTKL
ncbi:hypothetical protein E8E13_001044 [Curvularia kusanoi]|uniref:Uncharacterized protein n=1 Tax=Curvularia kusanoi TaxID=90978 RepID=A0A9P4W390_CURKU|nr:hypothetical protein E8E13_001044 [Curvularia kusanoi]